jgi:hypothetical protein
MTLKSGPIYAATPLNTITCETLLADYIEYCQPYPTTREEVKVQAETSKENAADAALQAYLSNMRAQAELYYSNTNGYGTIAQSCSAGIFSSTDSRGLSQLYKSVLGLSSSVVCNASKPDTKGQAQSWVVSAKSSQSGKYFCSDSTGNIKEQSRLNTPTETECQ